MARRSLRCELITALRGLNAAVRSSVTGVQAISLNSRQQKATTATATAVAEAGVNLDDTQGLFSSISTAKLIKSIITLRLVGLEFAADLGSWALNPKRMADPLWRKVVLGATEHTFYEHFCAGKDLTAVAATMEKLRRDGLQGMLDYGLEHADDTVSCDRNLEEFLETIDWTAANATLPVSFIVVKVTAICPPKLLKRASDLLRWEHRDSSINLPWKLQTFPLFSDSSPFHHTPKKPDSLTKHEEDDLRLAYERLRKICRRSVSSNVSLLIDAEDTSIQPAIDHFTYSAAIEFNRGNQTPILFNTIQAYLKDAAERLVAAKKAADGMGIPMGFKLVRGAYMSSENHLAAALGAPSPIHGSIHKTHECYNSCASFLLDEIARGSGYAVLATHNLESGKLAARKARAEVGIERRSECLQFAQLYGMAEVLSYGLRNAGFRVSKYLPFGPVEQIMPYLLRRAEENRGLLSTSVLDRKLMSKEVLRRLRSGSS